MYNDQEGACRETGPLLSYPPPPRATVYPRVQKIMIKVRRRQPVVKEKCVNLQL